LESSGFCFFVGGVISDAGLGLFGRGHRALGHNAKSQFLA